MKPEDLQRYFEEQEHLLGPLPPLPPPTREEIAEFFQALEEMDGHPVEGAMTLRIIVDRIVAWPANSNEMAKEDSVAPALPADQN